jgi:hypothetical protein
VGGRRRGLARARVARAPGPLRRRVVPRGDGELRIEVERVDDLFAELRDAGVLHPVSRGGVDETGFGTREFSALDGDGNLLSFSRWVEPPGSG